MVLPHCWISGNRWHTHRVYFRVCGGVQSLTCTVSRFLVAHLCGSLLRRSCESFPIWALLHASRPVPRRLCCQTKNWFGFFGKWRMHVRSWCQRWCHPGPAETQASAPPYPACMWRAALENTHTLILHPIDTIGTWKFSSRWLLSTALQPHHFLFLYLCVHISLVFLGTICVFVVVQVLNVVSFVSLLHSNVFCSDVTCLHDLSFHVLSLGIVKAIINPHRKMS